METARSTRNVQSGDTTGNVQERNEGVTGNLHDGGTTGNVHAHYVGINGNWKTRDVDMSCTGNPVRCQNMIKNQ